MKNNRSMPLWLIPMFYTLASVIAGLILPRLESAFFASYTHGTSVGSALAFFSAVSSGMMALTGIVFAVAFVLVQFSAVAYSPRLAIEFANSPTLFHTLGIFIATFAYSLAALVWTDRGGSGTVPLFSSLMVGILLVVSMLAFAMLIQSISGLQIQNVLQTVGARGRSLIPVMFPRIAGESPIGRDPLAATAQLGPPSQILTYSGEPQVIASFNFAALLHLAQTADAVITIEWGVGDTLMDGAVLLRVHGAKQRLSDQALRRAIHLSTTRTFEQDPKYPIRLLVDIAIRALSPAVNDPTTAVQALDQIEDLLRQLGRRELDAGYIRDTTGEIRVTFPVPTWQDYLALSFDEIRQFGATSVQVDRRLRAALLGLVDTIAVDDRRAAVRAYLKHLDQGIAGSDFDEQDRAAALQEDRQGLGLSRRRRAIKSAPAV